MSDAQILAEVADGVGTLTLNRPKMLNAFSDDMREELFRRLEGFAADPAVRVIVITGAGRAFCAGGDIASMVDLQNRDDLSVLEGRMAAASQVVQLLRRLPKPIIAAVNGAAAGGGMNLALACDMRLGSESAVFAQSFVKIGLAPDWGGYANLVRLIGGAKAMELMMTGEKIDAAEAHRLGLLNHVYGSDVFREQAGAFARRLATGPAQALAGIKQGVYLGAEASLPDALAYEFVTQRALFLSADAREGMRAFLEKRAAVFGAG